MEKHNIFRKSVRGGGLSSPKFLSPSCGLILFKHPAEHKRDRELLVLIQSTLHTVDDTMDDIQVSF